MVIQYLDFYMGLTVPCCFHCFKFKNKCSVYILLTSNNNYNIHLQSHY